MSTASEEPELQTQVKDPEPEITPELNPEPEQGSVNGSEPESTVTHEVPQQSEAEKPSPSAESGQPELKKDEGNRTFTMRELLSELKNEGPEAEGERPDGSSPHRLVRRLHF